MRRWFVAVALFLVPVVLPTALPTTAEAKSKVRETAASSSEASRAKVLDALQKELERSTRLTTEGFEPPYFVGYAMRDVSRLNVNGKYGAIYESNFSRGRSLYAEVRVGSYDMDNSGEGGFEFNFDPDADYGSLFNYVRAPVDDDPVALRDALWLLTDYKYKEALGGYLRKKSKAIYSVARKGDPLADFTKEEPAKYIAKPVEPKVDLAYWEGIVRSEGAYLKKYKEIFDSGFTATVQATTKYLVNTEGTAIIYDEIVYAFSASALTRADDGQLLEGSRTFYSRTFETFPSPAAIHKEVVAMVDELLEQRTSEVLNPYSGPVVLAPRVTGVFFHEAIGHRLEGKRQRSEKEGQTFKDKMGEAILPAFISVFDDPSMAKWEKTDLNGHYPYDDEGVKARKVSLIEDGVLKGFLLSRLPIEGYSKSNGHGRNASFEDPMGRMANLVVKGKTPVSTEKLKKQLIDEAKRQGKPFGIWIEEVAGGETRTGRGDVQAFHGVPTKMYKVDVKTGKMTMVRGAEFIGTPLTVISKILGTGDEYQVFNGFCGAESGYVPVSTVAPYVLLQELELQRASSQKRKPPILPPPVFDTIQATPPQP